MHVKRPELGVQQQLRAFVTWLPLPRVLLHVNLHSKQKIQEANSSRRKKCQCGTTNWCHAFDLILTCPLPLVASLDDSIEVGQATRNQTMPIWAQVVYLRMLVLLAVVTWVQYIGLPTAYNTRHLACVCVCV